MKHKLNIPALFLALLFLVASNGVAFSQHICQSSGKNKIGLFSKAACGCSENTEAASNACCKNKQFFSKYLFDGFAASILHVETVKIIPVDFMAVNCLPFSAYYLTQEYSGIPPPDNLSVKHLLRPTAEKLSIYRC